MAGDSHSHVTSRSSESRLARSGIPSLKDSSRTSLTSPAGGYSELGATDELHHAMPYKDKNPEYHFSLNLWRGSCPDHLFVQPVVSLCQNREHS